MKLVSIQVGRPRSLAGPADRVLRTGYGKQPVLFPVHASVGGLAGDGQADQRFHGGPDQAALAYPADHYPLWREELAWPALPHGGFGENLTISGADETSVCIGDVWRCTGGAVLQVTSPRKPCAKISQFWNRPNLLELVEATGRIGWYLRVLEEGDLAPGDVELAARPHPDWTIRRAMQVRRRMRSMQHEADELAGLPELGERWREALSR